MAGVTLSNLNDPRFTALGMLLGTTTFDAIGRMAMVYKYCTEAQSHLVSDFMLRAIAHHENFGELMIESGLGERLSSGEIRVKGTRGRIEWLARLRKNSRKGGQKNRANWLSKRLAQRQGVLDSPITTTITTTNTNKKKNAKTSSPPATPPTADPKKEKEIVAELRGVAGEELLGEVSLRGQRAWVAAYGVEHVRRCWPEIYAQWEADTERNAQGGLAAYARRFLQNEKANPRPGPIVRVVRDLGAENA